MLDKSACRGLVVLLVFLIPLSVSCNRPPEAPRAAVEAPKPLPPAPAVPIPDTLVLASVYQQDAEGIVRWREVSGEGGGVGARLGRNLFAQQIAAQGQLVAVTSERAANAVQPAALWISTNGGRSFREALRLGIGDQITSMVISRGARSIVVATLPDSPPGPGLTDTRRNVVREVPVDGGPVRVLFQARVPGVFLGGFDPESRRLLYFDGCYGCDTNGFVELKSLDVATSTAGPALRGNGFGQVVMRADHQEYLTMEETHYSYEQLPLPSMDGYSGSPYRACRVSAISAAQVNCWQFGGKMRVQAQQAGSVAVGDTGGLGYLAGTDEPYHFTGRKILGQAGEIFDAGEVINRVLFATAHDAVVLSGTAKSMRLVHLHKARNPNAVPEAWRAPMPAAVSWRP